MQPTVEQLIALRLAERWGPTGVRLTALGREYLTALQDVKDTQDPTWPDA